MNLRELARGKPCLVRLPGCLGDDESVVLAHYRLSGICGTGIKPPDIVGAWCCAKCHDIVDRRIRIDESTEYLRLAHAEGVMRTLAALVKMGAIK